MNFTKNELATMTVPQMRALAVENEIAVEKRAKKTDIHDALVAFIDANETDTSMSVAQLARELGLNPKIARAKLRRRGIFATNGSHVRFDRDDDVYHRYVDIFTRKTTRVE